MGEQQKPSIVVGLYTGKYVNASFTYNVLGITSALAKEGMWNNLFWAQSVRVDTNRNYLIHDFLHKSDGTHLFIMDEDMLHPPTMPILLAARNKPIISGLYFRRSETGEYSPQFYKYAGEGTENRRGHGKDKNDSFRVMTPEVLNFFQKCGDLPQENGPLLIQHEDGTLPESGLMRIDGGGFGCLLISREALEQMDEPYLRDEPALNGDLVFYKQARKKGIEIWGDAAQIAGHIDAQPIGLKAFYEHANRWTDALERDATPEILEAVRERSEEAMVSLL